jgi:mannose-6-phosphate isomerase-like protein (cupin superfamily)
MKGYVEDIEAVTERNNDFRRVVYTGPHLQLVVMSIQPGDEIGEEVHDDTDQFLRIEVGRGEVVINSRSSVVEGDSGIVVPAGARHNVVNTGDKPLKLYTIYVPPHHADGTIHRTKADAERSDEHFTGKTTE